MSGEEFRRRPEKNDFKGGTRQLDFAGYAFAESQ
jgi:hypothetical protein